MPRTCYALLLSQVVWVFRSRGSRLFLFLIEKERRMKCNNKKEDVVSENENGHSEKMKETRNKQTTESASAPQMSNPEITEVLDILKKYENRTIVLAATYIIRRLAFFPPCSSMEYINEIEMNRMQFGKEGAIDMLLSYLEKWADDRDVVEKSICALGNISLVTPNLKELTQKNGIDISTKFFFKYQDDPQVFDYSSFVLQQLAAHSQDNIEKIYSHGVVDVLMKKLCQPECPSIVFVAALELMAQLCKDSQIRCNVVNKVLPVVKSSLTKYQTDANGLFSILDFVVTICENDLHVCHIATSLNLDDIILNIRNMYKHNSEILNQSNIALFTILWQQNDLKLLKKLVEMIIESMKLYPLDKYLQHKSIVMLVVLAETSATLKQYIVQLDGITLVENLAKTQAQSSYYKRVIAILSNRVLQQQEPENNNNGSDQTQENEINE